MIDGLDEFAYLDELINHNSQNPNKPPIVNVLADALNIQKHKCVVAEQVGAIYKNKDSIKMFRQVYYSNIKNIKNNGY